MAANEHAPSQRIASLDAVRGLAMFLTTTGGILAIGVQGITYSPTIKSILRHVSHAPWNGATYADLAFPAYVVFMGAALQIGLTRARERGVGIAQILGGAAQRSLILFFLGIICNGGLEHPWPDVRIAGVLQRLAICYFVCCAVFVLSPRWAPRWLFGGILLGYWALLAWVPVPGYEAGDLTREGNLVAYIDQQFLPGRGNLGNWDSEGILTTVPSIASCLFGMMLGQFFLAPRPFRARILVLTSIGVACVLAGLLWSRWFPINKYLWTSSFVLLSGGFATLHLGAFEVVADRWKGALLPFLVYGRNSLAAFVGFILFPMGPLAQTLVGGSVAIALGRYAGLATALVAIGIQFVALLWLYRNRIFIRL